MLKIAIISHLKYPISEPFYGGLEMHTHLLTRELQARGHEITLYAASGSDTRLQLIPLCAPTRTATIPTPENEAEEFFIEHQVYFQLMMDLRRSNFDVVHNNSLHYLPISMAPLLPMPMVTSLHTPPFPWLAQAIQHNREENNCLVAVSRKTKELWQNTYPVQQVICNGIDVKDFPFSSQPIDPPYSVWYGRIVPEKGLHLAIEAALKAQIPLKIAGPIGDEQYYKKEVLPLIKNQISYCGHLDHAALAKLIAGARVTLCTPRWEEPYGLVIAESLACGVPVAGFNRGALPDLITPQTGALATPDDTDDLAQAVFKAQKCKREECRRYASDKASSTSMVEKYLALYTKQIQPRKTS